MPVISQQDKESLLRSGQFDADWYMAAYHDVRDTGLDAAEHFLRIGKRLGRSANARAYEAQNDTAAPGDTRTAPPASPSVDERATDMAAVDGHVPDEVRRLAHRSRLFDPDWYRSRFERFITQPDDLLHDYLTSLEIDPRRDPGPLFSTSFYAANHSDLSGMHPFVHFLRYGMHEGRTAFAPAKVNRLLENADLAQVEQPAALLESGRPTVVLSWADGNVFFGEIARYTAQYLSGLGFCAEHAEALTDRDPATCNIVIVAPHEFCVYGPGRDWPAETLEQAIYFNTEQWQAGPFVLAYGFAVRSAKVLDLNPASAAVFAQLGIRAAFVPLLPIAGSCFDHPDQPLSARVRQLKAVKPLTHPERFADRPYDVLFVGAANERRSRLLAALAPALSEFDSFLHCPRFDRPVDASDPDMLSSADVAQLARNSKILLNIHEDEGRYFEWHRLFLSGMMEGCVVLTEPCDHMGAASPSEHYLEATAEDMPSLLHRLLRMSDGQATMERIHGNCRALRDKVVAGGAGWWRDREPRR